MLLIAISLNKLVEKQKKICFFYLQLEQDLNIIHNIQIPTSDLNDSLVKYLKYLP